CSPSRALRTVALQLVKPPSNVTVMRRAPLIMRMVRIIELPENCTPLDTETPILLPGALSIAFCSVPRRVDDIRSERTNGRPASLISTLNCELALELVVGPPVTGRLARVSLIETTTDLP